MSTTGFKVGQKWRVVNAVVVNECMPEEFAHVRNGDLLLVHEGCDNHQRKATIAQTGDITFICDMDIEQDAIVLSEDTIESPTEASEDVSPAWATSVPDEVESVSQESIGSPTDNSKDILWHIISRAERYNGHSQLTVSQMDLSTLITLTRMLDDYVTEFCELRLSWGGDHMGYYTADIYEIASARDGAAEDKILMQIEKVTGVS